MANFCSHVGFICFLKAYTINICTECTVFKIYFSKKHSVGPDPAHIWAVWNPREPDVGMILAGTILLSGKKKKNNNTIKYHEKSGT